MRTIQREIVGAFIFSADDKILLGKAGVFSESWSIPGGGIENDETMVEALNREILEETGIDISQSTTKKLEGISTGISEKTLRDTKERVTVEMIFHDYNVSLPLLSHDVALSFADDFTDGKWFTSTQLKDIKIAPPTEKRLIQIGFIATYND
jgi:8-oxo-dGTP pyrophosphatase MutT (NUDIX family)